MTISTCINYREKREMETIFWDGGSICQNNKKLVLWKYSLKQNQHFIKSCSFSFKKLKEKSKIKCVNNAKVEVLHFKKKHVFCLIQLHFDDSKLS